MQYTYNAAGQVLTKTYANGTVDSFTYDAYGDLTSDDRPDRHDHAHLQRRRRAHPDHSIRRGSI